MGACLDDLRKNYGRGLTDKEITEIFEEARELYKRVSASQKASSQSAYAQQLAKQNAEREQISLALKKRNTWMQICCKGEIVERVLTEWQGREAEGLIAQMVGGNKLREGARMSVDSLRLGVKGEYLGGLFNDIEALGKEHLAIFTKGSMDRR